MRVLERRLVFLGAALLILAFGIWAAGGAHFRTPNTRNAASGSPLTYYGGDISSNGGMAVATGVDANNPSRPSNGPWPQFVRNYCFLAVVQAVVNYQYWVEGAAIPFPHQDNQGPADGIAGDSTSGANGTAWQILYDMEHYMVPPGGPVPPPRVVYAGKHCQGLWRRSARPSLCDLVRSA